MNSVGLQIFDNDKDIMSFDNINNDEWDNGNYFAVSAPQTFTMPSHNVIFVAAPR